MGPQPVPNTGRRDPSAIHIRCTPPANTLPWLCSFVGGSAFLKVRPEAGSDATGTIMKSALAA
eukprot:736394-Heterocapsa_arctica.AAC.1